ncbi:hypothetical protein GWI33_008283 [Rhynchophorus ferrugineus]|uniref:Uncharacterized protein n=1 Tax=Rhynchophorus ferrugineus TaxID=354439 RepID=A0A834IT06_RHYFE|nr:hypothetical protein GWI33_008283 [Rhynchophorus ferrugineus]
MVNQSGIIHSPVNARFKRKTDTSLRRHPFQLKQDNKTFAGTEKKQRQDRREGRDVFIFAADICNSRSCLLFIIFHYLCAPFSRPDGPRRRPRRCLAEPP